MEKKVLRGFGGGLTESANVGGGESKLVEVRSAGEVIGEESGDRNGVLAVHLLIPMAPLDRVEVD